MAGLGSGSPTIEFMNGKHLSFSILQFDKIKGAIPVERLLNKPLLKCNGDFGLFRFDDQMRQKQTQNMHGFVATERPGVAVTPPGILLARKSRRVLQSGFIGRPFLSVTRSRWLQPRGSISFLVGSPFRRKPPFQMPAFRHIRHE